ncbi:glycosyl transferase family 2 [Glaciihabitans tibetensis]|uniref:Glycosyl transferase family 2 n=1 Tax=Glaciihabitans tibetensis TaxID=1266600 RepID=A0A2T0VA22_9MICO|nr:glycosyltransferase [Glaciihabitans tibetensis]PRY67030.1 glycosyl transferase family 2 [Glaciihabitans tibetensis]
MTTATSSPAPGPTRIVQIDLDDPLPTLSADERYRAAMVIGWRHGVPCGSVTVDLGQDPAVVRAQLEALRADTQSVETPEAVPDAALPSISVVVPTMFERPDDLVVLLKAFTALEYPRVEFLLVDNRRSIPHPDPLPALVATEPRLRIVRAERPGISSARNAGLAAATGDVVAFTDDDVRVEPDWLRAIGSRYVREPELDAVTGLVLPAELERPAQIYFERYYGGFYSERIFAPLSVQARPGQSGLLRNSVMTVWNTAGESVREFSVYGAGAFATGANMTYRRSALERLGGFDLALGTGTPARGGEDLATVISLLWNGGRIGYEPSSVVHHRHRRELDELLSQMHGNGIGFTAMLTSLLIHDRRHVAALAAGVPSAFFRMRRQNAEKLRAQEPAAHEPAALDPHFPRELMTREMRAYPRGPLAYLRSRRKMKEWAPAGAEPSAGLEAAVGV